MCESNRGMSSNDNNLMEFEVFKQLFTNMYQHKQVRDGILTAIRLGREIIDRSPKCTCDVSNETQCQINKFNQKVNRIIADMKRNYPSENYHSVLSGYNTPSRFGLVSTS